MLEHVFAPFLECCGDAVMFAKRNAADDDEDDVAAITIVVLLMKSCGGGYEMRFPLIFLENIRVLLLLFFSLIN